MKLLKIGDRYINLDLVTDIRVSESKITVYLAVGSPDGVRTLTFQDDDAKTLQTWLSKSDNAEDPSRKPPRGMGVIQGAAKRQD